MRIVVAAPLYPPEPGGPATYARILAESLPERGIEVDVVKFSDTAHLSKRMRTLAYFWNLYRAARSADVVFALDPVSTGLPAYIAAKLRRTPFVIKIVGDYAWEQGSQRFGITSSLDEFVQTASVPLPVAILRGIQRHVTQGATKVIVPSAYLKRIVETWGVPSAKIDIIYNAVLPEEPAEIPAEVEALTRPRIVTVGRLVPWKGIPGVIDAVQKVRESQPNTSLVVVGSGPEEQSLERYAATQLGRGYCMTGALSHAQTLAVIKDADVFVLNSTYEGLSHLLIEALTLGTPIVATNVGGNAEVIEDGKTGLLVTSGDTDELAQACQKVLFDAMLRSTFTDHAQSSAQRFTKDTMVERITECLRTIV